MTSSAIPMLSLHGYAPDAETTSASISTASPGSIR